MANLKQVVGAYVASCPSLDRASFSRLENWVQALGQHDVSTVRWRDVDLKARTASVTRTKNGQPIVAALTAACVTEPERLPGKHPDTLVFAGRHDSRPHSWRGVWRRTCVAAGLPGRNFHQLRHGGGSALANAGVGQTQIMAVLRHKTPSASARYMHANVDDQRRVVDQVFG